MIWRRLKDNLNRLPSWLLRAYLAVFIFVFLFGGDVVAAIIFALMFVISMIPVIINEIYNVKLHWLHELAFTFLVFAHMAGFSGLYNAFPLWDDLAHILGAVIITLISFSFIYAYEMKDKIKLTLPMIAFFSASVTMALGSIWEISEFIWDNLILFSISYGFAQNGLLDTMLDLTWDFSGSIMSSFMLVYYVRKSSDKNKERFFKPFTKMISSQKGVEN